jgi:hypothetical protein
MDIPRDIHKMETASDCVVVYAERVGGNVIIEFNDGKCALYSASFLHSMLTQANNLDTSDSEEE